MLCPNFLMVWYADIIIFGGFVVPTHLSHFSNNQPSTGLFDKRDDFKFVIIQFSTPCW
jgi:hypothetical protein